MTTIMNPKKRRALSRAISAVEDNNAAAAEVLREAYRQPRQVPVIGLTGPPGAGKSTLAGAMTDYLARAGERIAVLAIDPSSPFSGGAVLGDRIRMERGSAFDNVYVRSVSARGHGGGLTETAADVIAILGAYGFDRVVLETVGAGQADVEVADQADCTVVVNMPGSGDGVQASKAGIMEIGDVYVVNKADMAGARSTVRDIDGNLGFAYTGHPGVNETDANSENEVSGTPSPGARALTQRHGNARAEHSIWRPPVLEVIAEQSVGIEALVAAVDSFLDWSRETGREQRKRQAIVEKRVTSLLAQRLLAPYVATESTPTERTLVSVWAEHVLSGKFSPQEAVDALLAEKTGGV